MNKRILVILIAAMVLGLIVFAMSPAGGDLLAVAGTGGCRKVVEKVDTAGRVDLGCRRAVGFYAAGTCSGKCAFVLALPNDAKYALKQFTYREVVSFTYVRMVDKDLEPVDKLATICYKTTVLDKVNNPTIWICNSHSDAWTLGSGYWDKYDRPCVNNYGKFSTVLVGFSK